MTSKAEAHITFVSAGAGSGKTYRLTELLHRELTAGGARPSGVIATTFTKKAATELRERVREHLLKQGNFSLANVMGQARIGTVNSVCGQLIARFAFEAGLSTEQQVLEEVQAGILLGRAIDAVLDGSEMRQLLSLVRRLGLEPDSKDTYKSNWRDDLKSLVDQIRSNDIPQAQVRSFAQANADDLLGHFPKPVGRCLDTDLLNAIRLALPTIEAAALSGGKKNTNAYLTLIKGFASDLEEKVAPWSDWVKVAKEAPEASLRQTIEPIADLAGRVAEHGGLHTDLRRYLELMFDLAAKALENYQDLKQELGVLDFADQEHQLLGLLDQPEVAAVLDDELDLLMVDEFQDTNPIQLALFLKLARFAKKVYWVGDIKQAIYGFRGSDTELMQAILSALPDLGGAKEVLQSSWRSRPELVKTVNAVFTHAFESSLPREEVQLNPERTESLTGPALANWILGGKNAKSEASALASGVLKLIDDPEYEVYDKATKEQRQVQFGDIAILSRSNEGVGVLAAALSKQGIPVATAQPGLLATPEATLALACLRRLNDPGDTVATAEIISLSDCLQPEIWVADRLNYLAQGGEAHLWLEQAMEGHSAYPVLETIAALRSSLPVFTPREALVAVITSCSLTEKIVRWTTDPARVRVRLANLEALIALAERYEDYCRGGRLAASISGLIVWLGEIAEQGQDLLAESAINAVKVMTHHAAKGLEWPVVILTDLAKDIKDRLWSISAQSGTDFDAQNPLANRYIRYWPWPFGQQKKVAVSDAIANSPIADGFRKMAIEESKRLLYVSMTRARDLLVLARSSRKLSGEWLDCVEAPWLLPETGSAHVTLPCGERIAAERWMLEPAEDPKDVEKPESGLYWFPSASGVESRLPLSFNPSLAMPVPTTVLEKCRVGERIQVAQGADMSVLGVAIHACIGLSFTDRNAPLSVREVENVLSGFGVLPHLSPAAVMRQISAFHEWLASRWPSARPYAEIAVQSLWPSGQVLNGRIDLLLETDAGWVLIDHKSSQLPLDHWDQLATEYGGQLAAYANGVERASGKKVTERWLFLPVAGGALSIGL